MLKDFAAASTERSCGSCTLCCKVLAVHSINKPVEVWCEHCAVGKGCKIYESRPVECQSFRCMWLDGVLEEEMFPPLTKVVVTGDGDKKMNVEGHEILLAQFHEAQPGAAERGPIKRAIERFRNAGIACVIVPPGKANRRLLMPNRPPISVEAP